MVCVGTVTGAHGIRGHIRIKSHTADPDSIADYGPVFDEDGERPMELTVTGHTRGLVVASVAGIGDRNGAEALRGRNLFIPRRALPEPADDEVYHADLIGLVAEVRGSERPGPALILGTICAVHQFGAGDVLEVEIGSRRNGSGQGAGADNGDDAEGADNGDGAEGAGAASADPSRGAGGTVMVPFTYDAVPDVDLERGRIVVAPLPGLLDWDRLFGLQPEGDVNSGTSADETEEREHAKEQPQ